MKKSVVIFLSGLLLMISCKKEDSVLGLDVQPENDLLYATFYEGSHTISQTVREDSILSSLNNLGVYLLGSYNDPVFGRSDASIYTNFILKDNITNVNTGTKPQMDSVVLSLAYKVDYYGDTTDQMKVNVYMLTDSTSPSTHYFSNSTKSYTPTDITESGNGYSFYPHPVAKVTIDTSKANPQLRIRLSKQWFEENMLAQDNIYLTNSTAMQQIFKGLYITTENTTVLSPDFGSVLFFGLYDANTKLTFYYHNFSSSGLKLDFSCGSGTGHFNHFEHDYGTAHSSLKSQISSIAFSADTVYGQQQIFLQSMAGLGAKIQFPDLKHLCDSGAISVAQAQLIIPADLDPTWQLDGYKAPNGLWMKAYNEDGTFTTVKDAGSYWFNGSYDVTNKVYKFDIARHVSDICNGVKGNYGFYIYPAESTSKPYRVVLGGGKNSQYPIKLKIAYTKLFKQ